MSGFNLLPLEDTPIYEQLQIEEALLRADTGNWCILNKGSPPAIVMGISGKEHELIHADALLENPMPVIRRFSGGGTVVVDEGTLFVTWIANAGELNVPCCPKKMMEWTAAFYRPLFEGIDFRLTENDYTIGHKKCGGNAQYLCKQRWLHHTSFLWDYAEAHMRLLKMPPKTPAYRGQRHHHEFLCRLRDHLAGPQALFDGLVTHLEAERDVTLTSLQEIRPLLERPHRRATKIVSQ